MKKYVVMLMALLALVSLAHAGDIWVDDDGSNDDGTGSFAEPYKTVTWVLANNLAASGDVIKLKAGTFDEALGEVFPLTLPNGVDLEGTEFSSGVPLAEIGGDVADSTVLGLVRVDAANGARQGIDISGLRFLGEYTANKDAPSAIYVVSRAGYTVQVSVDECLVERPEMDDAGATDKASIVLDLGHGSSTITIDGSEIWASRRAAVEVVLGSGTGSTTVAEPTISILGNDILIDGTDVADYGVRWTVAGEVWVDGDLVVRGNLIDSSGATPGYGIGNGLSVSLAPSGNGDATLDYDEEPEISRNQIKGCLANGIELICDPEGSASGHLSIWNVERNRVSDCGDAALRVVREDTGGVGGYLTLITKSNWFVACDYGLHFVGDASGGHQKMTNDTIAGNDVWGLKIENDSQGPASMVNCILWGNGNCENCNQYDAGTTGWTPSGAQYCDIDNYSGGTGNIDARPEFVSQSSGNFHLSSTSPCIDTGDNTPYDGELLSEFDIDNADRTVDGDGDSRVFVDIGADEYDP